MEPSTDTEAVRVHVRALGIAEARPYLDGWGPLNPQDLKGTMAAVLVAGTGDLYAATTHEVAMAAALTRGRWEAQPADFPAEYDPPRGINHLLLVRPARRRKPQTG